jgi:hypothetical protein
LRLQYRDWAWNAFVAINATARTDSGFAALTDVNAPNGGSQSDNQESFLFAEVMKYSYLIHAEGMCPHARCSRPNELERAKTDDYRC